METRFEIYKRVIVQPFFEQVARDVDHQIVLVDVPPRGRQSLVA